MGGWPRVNAVGWRVQWVGNSVRMCKMERQSRLDSRGDRG